jgi:hypothetical protein
LSPEEGIPGNPHFQSLKLNAPILPKNRSHMAAQDIWMEEGECQEQTGKSRVNKIGAFEAAKQIPTTMR